MVCTYTSSQDIAVDSMVSQFHSELDRSIASSVPVWIQAWGGNGGNVETNGLDASAKSGKPGYAITVASVGSLTDKHLYIYVANGGTHHKHSSGQGVVAVAGGSYISGGDGGGEYADGSAGEFRGIGGNEGPSGSGGEAGGSSQDGNPGPGGIGGAWESGGSTVGWNEVGSVDPDASSWTGAPAATARAAAATEAAAAARRATRAVAVAAAGRTPTLSPTRARPPARSRARLRGQVILTFNLS
jgi:hypothetical protein